MNESTPISMSNVALLQVAALNENTNLLIPNTLALTAQSAILSTNLTQLLTSIEGTLNLITAIRDLGVLIARQTIMLGAVNKSRQLHIAVIQFEKSINKIFGQMSVPHPQVGMLSSQTKNTDIGRRFLDSFINPATTKMFGGKIAATYKKFGGARMTKNMGNMFTQMKGAGASMMMMAIVMAPFMAAVNGFLGPFQILTNTWGILGTLIGVKLLPAILFVNSALLALIPLLLGNSNEMKLFNTTLLNLAITVKTVKDQFIALDNVLFKFDLNEIFLKPFENYEWDGTIIANIWNGLATKVTDGFKAVIDKKVSVVSDYIYTEFGVRL